MVRETVISINESFIILKTSMYPIDYREYRISNYGN